MLPNALDLVQRSPHATLFLSSCPAASNNDRTWHFQKLILHVLTKLRAAASDASTVPTDAANAVHLTRVLLKYATEHATHDSLRVLLQDPPGSAIPPGAREAQPEAPALASCSSAMFRGVTVLGGKNCDAGRTELPPPLPAEATISRDGLLVDLVVAAFRILATGPVTCVSLHLLKTRALYSPQPLSTA